MAQFTCRAVLFDLDGVLVDSTASVGRVWRRWAEEHGLNPGPVIRSAQGRRSIETIRMWAPQVDAWEENHKVEQMEIDDTRLLRVISGARELLAGVGDAHYAIVTSGTRKLAYSRLRAAGLKAPPVVITADDVAMGKPHPEPWLKAATALGVPPRACVALEDTPPGISSARAAGTRVIALTSTYPASALATADAVIDSLTEIRVGPGSNGRLLLRVRGSAALTDPGAAFLRRR